MIKINVTCDHAAIRINEWMSNNTRTLADPADGQFHSWFELYNAGTTNFNLSGYYLAGSLTNLTIERYSISGANASSFSIGTFTANSIITEGGELILPITVTSSSGAGPLTSTLTIFTDESTGLGGVGDTFTYLLSARSIPEPTSLAVLGAGLAGLASFRRRRKA